MFVVDEVGSSGFGFGLVIRTWTNCSSAASTATPDRAKPRPGIRTANLWSICARSRPPSQATLVLMETASLIGSISWQFSGRKCVKLATSNWWRLQVAPLPRTQSYSSLWPRASDVGELGILGGRPAEEGVGSGVLTESVTTFDARMAW